MKSLQALLLTAAVGAGAPATAHHAFSAEFDAKQPIDLKGVVTKTKWVNPHSWIYIDVKEADGSVTNWGLEFGAPATLQRLGLNKATLPVGTEVLLRGYRSRNGQAYGYTVTATLADGRTFLVGAPQDTADTRFSAVVEK
jgi:Family of unknown function (DUF6152)